jgi:hypothetical protein
MEKNKERKNNNNSPKTRYDFIFNIFNNVNISMK